MKPKKLFSGRSGRGSVLLIVGLLVGSAVIRIGVGAGQAVATENPMVSEVKEEESKPKALTGSGMSPEDKSRMSEMLRTFQEREAKIAEKEDQIAVRMKALSVADEQLQRRLTVLEEAENSLRGLLALADTAAEDDLARLTAVYENMKPKQAAPLFEQMEPAFAAGFLGRMRPDAAAGIMAGLSPEVAYSISVILAGRNADVPKG
ncbi:MotE family protein [Roseobacter sp.]|uniref:MotE family protein n=1 Tax=Roseobacter sp. TaxID=1907202 RepID=UPI00385EE768